MKIFGTITIPFLLGVLIGQNGTQYLMTLTSMVLFCLTATLLATILCSITLGWFLKFFGIPEGTRRKWLEDRWPKLRAN